MCLYKDCSEKKVQNLKDHIATIFSLSLKIFVSQKLKNFVAF